MATIKVIFRVASRGREEGTLYYRIIHRRKVRQIHTGNRILQKEWDEKEGRVVIGGSPTRKEYLCAMQAHLNDCIRRLNGIVEALENGGADYTSDDVVQQYAHADAAVGFISFARSLIADCKNIGRLSASEHYSSALNSFIRFYGDRELPFEEFDCRLIDGYEQFLRESDLTPNTTSYYMRKLRAIYNQAVDRELTVQRNPFKHVYTGIAKTKKRAVSIDIIKALRDIDLRHDPLSGLARDMFLFSFYTRGMAIVDMSYLRKSDLRNGCLCYRRQKTKQHMAIRWEPKMEEIVKRYEIADSEFMLPLIKPNGKDKRQQYQNASHLINRRLKKLGEQLHLAEPLTMYRARHAWASIAHDNNVPVSVISQGMGHDSEKTTRIYLASLDTSSVDKANKDIINLLEK